MEDFEVVADGWLGHPKSANEFAGTHLIIAGRNQGKEAEARRVGERFETPGEVFGIHWRESFFEDGGAADRHKYILTDIDT